MSEGALEINDDNFEKEALQADTPVLVDFWAPWCGPCRAMEPVIDEIAAEFGDKVKIYKCNVDDNPVAPGKYGVKAIPTLIIFKDGEVKEQITGMVAKTRLEEAINQLV